MKMILAIIQFQIFRFPYIGKWAVLFSLLAISLEGMAQYRINLSVDQTQVEIGDTLQFSISLQTDAQQAAAYGTRFLLNIGTSNIGYLSDDSVKYMGLFGESSVAFTQYSQQKHEIDLAASATEGTGITNSGTIFTLFLVALDTGNVTLTVKDLELRDIDGNLLNSVSDSLALYIHNIAPLAPTNFTATADTQKVTLQWMANTEEDLAEYRIYYRQNDTLDYQQLSVVMVTESAHPTEFVHSGLEEKQPFSYWMQALDGDGNISDSSLVLRATVPDVTPPAKPQGFTGEATESSVSLVWQKNSEPDLAYYTIFRGVNSSILDSLTSIQGNAQPDSSFTDTLVVSGTIYEYVIKAVDSSNNKSLQSDTLRIMTFLSQIDLVAPENGLNEVNTAPNFSWIKTNGAQFYDIQIATDGEFINDVLLFENLDAPSYPSEVSLKYLTQYFWRVRGADSLLRKGPWSEVWNFKTKDFNETDGLVAYYRFNGNAADSSGNGKDGTVNGATLTTDRFGNANQAYSFDGVSSFIEIPDSDNLDNWSSATFSVWLNQTGTRIDGYRLIDKISAGEGNGYGFDTFGSGNGRSPRVLGAVNAVSSASYLLNVWNHVAVVIENDSAFFHINGVYLGKHEYTKGPSNTLTLRIGDGHGSVSNVKFKGSLDDIRIYNRALSTAEVLALYHQESAPQTPAGFLAEAGDNEVSLRWSPNTEPDFASYQLFRGTERENLSLVTTLESISDTVYTDSEVTNRIPYFYAIRAVDNDGYSSAFSDTLEVTPTSPFDVGLVAYYPFNGNAADSSGNGNNGTVNGATLTTDRFGNANQAYSFDGDDQINTPIPHTVLLNTTEMAVNIWIKPSLFPVNENQGVIGAVSNNNAQWVIRTEANTEGKRWRFVGYSEGAWRGYPFINDTPPIDQWQMLTIVVKPNSVSYFRDGRLINQEDVVFSSLGRQSSNIPNIVIGRESQSYPTFFYGSLDDIRIYNRALSDDEVLALYHQESAPQTPAGFLAEAGDNEVRLQWSPNTEPDFASYQLFRGTERENLSLLTTLESISDTVYADSEVTNRIPYFYAIRAMDNDGYSSAFSDTLEVVPTSVFDVGLVAYYPFNGNAADSSGNGNDGTVNGATLTTDRFGNANRAYAFDGVDDWISIAHNSSFDFSTKALSVGVIARIPFSSAEEYILSQGLELPFTLGIREGKYWLKMGNETENVSLSSQSAPENEYDYLFGTYDGSEVRLYVNGILEANTPFSADLMASSDSLHIGSRSSDNQWHIEGIMDDVRIYNRAITPQEVLDLYYVEMAPSTPNNISIAPGNGLVKLQWDANPEPDVSQYLIYIEGSDEFFSVADTAAIVGGLINGTSYTFTITALDESMNESAYSNSVTATPFDLNQGLTQDLRSYWSFDATNGAAVVDEVGTLDVTPTFENGIVSDGKLASFLQITGQSGDANAFPTYVQAVNEAFSHSFWFRTQNLEVSDLVWGQYATSAANINAFIGIENGQFFWTQRNSTWSTPEPFGANLSSDRWYFLTAAMDENGSFSIYVDAQEVFSGSLTGSSNTAATPLGLRGNFDFDEFAVYSRVLTHNEILALYNNGQGLGYPFDDSDSDVFAPHEPVFASIISAQSSLTLSWLANQDSDVAFYSIYRGTHRNQLDSLTAIFVGSAPDTAFVDTNIIADTTYFYSITATDLAGNQSSFSDTLAAKTTDQTPPNPVQNLGAQPGDKSVLLSWNPNTEPDLAYYALFRGTQRTSLDSLTSIMRGSAPDTAFSDTNVSYETTYHYAIAAVDEAGNISVMSDTISAKPLDLRPPLPPSAFVVNGFHRQARLFWSPSASADVAEYRLLRQVGNNPSFSDLSQVAAPDTNFIDNGINNGQTVTYRLFAVNQNGVSSDTLEASAQPRPPVLATRSKTKRVVPAHRNVITGEGFGDSSEGSSILITEVVNKESGASVLPNPQRETDFERADEALEIESTTTARKTAEITSSTQATIISWNDSTIVFSVPEDVTPGEKTVSLDLRGEEIIQNFSFTVLPTVTVWPGDTNNDGKVSAADLMRIAIYFGASETFDPLVDVSWGQWKRPAWTDDGGQPRRAYTDTNGDGIIDQNDLAALTVNYGETVGSGSKSIASDLQNAQQALTDTLHLVGHISHNQGRLLFEFRLENEEIPDILGMAFALELPDITTQTKAAWRTHRDAQGVQLELALPRMESGRVHASVGGESVTKLSRYGALGLLEITSPAVHPEKLSFHDLRVWNLSGSYYPTTLRLEEVMATSNEWESQLPQELSLSQNYPNPFNPSTTIRFGLPDAGTIVLEIFSLTGQRIGVYAQGAYNAGFHQVTINASNWASGVYFYRLRTENKVITKKMVLVK